MIQFATRFLFSRPWLFASYNQPQRHGNFVFPKEKLGLHSFNATVDSLSGQAHTEDELINQFALPSLIMSMPRVITALTARTQFGQILRRAGRQQERFIVDRRGNPEIVIMGLKDFLTTIAPEPEVLRAIRIEAKRNKTSKLTNKQIDQEISAYRRERRLKNAMPKGRP